MATGWNNRYRKITKTGERKKIEDLRLKPGAPVLREALLTVNGPSLGRLERYFAFLSTV